MSSRIKDKEVLLKDGSAEFMVETFEHEEIIQAVTLTDSGSESCEVILSKDLTPSCSLLADKEIYLPGDQATVSLSTNGKVEKAAINGSAVTLQANKGILSFAVSNENKLWNKNK